MKAFKAYDIRGIYPGEWDDVDAYKIGFFLPRLLNASEILVGRDVRLSSDEILMAVTNGIRDAGCNVINIGLATTPMVYWATAKFHLAGSVQITASHNPAEYNGLKVSGKDAMPIGFQAGLRKIKKWMETDVVEPVVHRGCISFLDLTKAYLDFLENYLPNLGKMKIGVDLSNGMAGLLLRKLFPKKVLMINDELDGSFPNHDPNPLEAKNLRQLSDLVSQNQLDLGMIYDGDADRVMFVDETGSFISPDLLIAVLGHYFLTGSKTKVLVDIRTSRSVAEYLKPMGAEVNIWKVGRAFATPMLKEIDGVFGGELAGHYYFKDFYYSDSGIMASLIILKV